MNYKLKKFEDKYAEEIRECFGNGIESIAQYLYAEYHNGDYKNYDKYIAYSIYYNVFHNVRNRLLRSNLNMTSDFYKYTIPGQISYSKEVTNDNIYTLVKFSFIKAYGRGWRDILLAYEEGTL